MPGNKQQTRNTILQAAHNLIADEGFTAFGVNALASCAGYDKVLIYRYFNNIEGVLARVLGAYPVHPTMVVATETTTGRSPRDSEAGETPADGGGSGLLPPGRDLCETLTAYVAWHRNNPFALSVLEWSLVVGAPDAHIVQPRLEAVRGRYFQDIAGYFSLDRAQAHMVRILFVGTLCGALANCDADSPFAQSATELVETLSPALPDWWRRIDAHPESTPPSPEAIAAALETAPYGGNAPSLQGAPPAAAFEDDEDEFPVELL